MKANDIEQTQRAKFPKLPSATSFGNISTQGNVT